MAPLQVDRRSPNKTFGIDSFSPFSGLDAPLRKVPTEYKTGVTKVSQPESFNKARGP